MNAREFRELTRTLGYRFNDHNLLERALTHRSSSIIHNETLEFLGDSVLSIVVSDYLFRRHSEATEGELTLYRTSIVNNRNALCEVAERISFADHIIIDSSFSKSNKTAWRNLLANTLEAVIGAIYLDGGLEAANEFVLKHFVLQFSKQDKGVRVDQKSRLQIFLQKRALSVPTYSITDVGGTDHCPFFTVACKVDLLESPVYGQGSTKKEAEHLAANRAYELLCRQESKS